ncbi:MAG: prepilin-type N-terminal cleavage/methylation domain-containing protein [Gemmatimonadota bacterium]
MVSALPRNSRGFTLVEALVAMVLSTVVVMLVTSVFLVQNRFYSDAMKRSGLHESVRGATALISSDLHGVSEGGIVAADPDAVTFRSPLLMGGVCGVDGQKTYLFLPVEGGFRDAALVSGYAVKQPSSEWRYTSVPWNSVYHSSGQTAAKACALSGADTTGAVSEFFRLDGLDASLVIQVGDLVMLYEEVELRLAPSHLHPGSRGVFRGPMGGRLTEVATGMSGDSGFEYGLADRNDFQDRINGKGNLTRIDRVRIFLEGIAPASTGGRDSLTFDLTLTVPLRNAN